MTSQPSPPVGTGRGALAAAGELATDEAKRPPLRGAADPAPERRSTSDGNAGSDPSAAAERRHPAPLGPRAAAVPSVKAAPRVNPSHGSVEGHLDSNVVEELTRRLPTSELVKIIKGALECGRRNVPFTESDLLRTMTFGSSAVPPRQLGRTRSPRS